MPEKRKNIAVAYARYSSAGQRDVSIEQQLRDIRAYAAREGYTIVHEYADHARSGYKNVSARSEFQAMIAAASSGEFDTVLTWKVDRFGRSRRDSAVYKSDLRRLGVRVIYVMEPIPEGAAGVITEGMLETIAEWYSRNLSENVTRGMSDNAVKCLANGSQLYGYCRGQDNRYAIQEDEAKVVRRIFNMYCEGYSFTRIVRDLNYSGLRTHKGKLFSLGHVQRILSQERYLGIYIWGDVRVPGGMPAIIDQETWGKAQQMKKKTGKHLETRPEEFFLTGKAFCGLCGAPMIGDSGTSKNGTRHYYYTCSCRKSGGSCRKKSFRKDALEDALIDSVLDQVLTDEQMEEIAAAVVAAQEEKKKSSPVIPMRGELRSVLSKIDNINNAIADGVWTSSTKQKLEELEETAASLRSSIQSYERAESGLLDYKRVLFRLKSFRDLDRSSPVHRREIVRTFLNTVVVYDDHMLIALNLVKGNASVPITDLEDLFPSSDAYHLVPRLILDSNIVAVCYRVAI